MQNAVAFANNDVVIMAWSYSKKPVGCMGFAIYRIDKDGQETVLPGFAIFKGDTPSSRPTSKYPIQKFYWKDPYARLEADKTGHRTFRYKIVPLEGDKHHLMPMKHLPFLTTNEVTVSPDISPGVRAIFNRGIISTQRVARALGDNPQKATLLQKIAVENDPLRKSLTGDMLKTLTGFVDRAQAGGKIYAALYELKDAELLAKLVGLGKQLHIVLSDAKKRVSDAGETEALDGREDTEATHDAAPAKKKTKVIDDNQAARDALSGKLGAQWDRIMPNNHIGHNKFLVYVDAAGTAQALLTGSTNWTPTGLCAQTNNTVVIDNPALVSRYLAYWTALAQDTAQAGGQAKLLQAQTLRAWDAQGEQIMLADGSAVHSWFAPNTLAPRKRKTPTEKRPADMEDLAQLIAQAQHSVLFLAFFPGTPSVADWAGAAQKAQPNLFVRGCVTNPSAAESFYYQLVGATAPPHSPGQHLPYKEDYRVFAAEAFDRQLPTGWQHELLNAGFAIIHDKVVVIDPFSDFPVVATGSHNLGHKASYDNDENLLIIRGNKPLALAYTTHILDVYDHFSARYWFNHQHSGQKQDLFLQENPNVWLSKYFNPKGEISNAQLKFWLQASMHNT